MTLNVGGVTGVLAGVQVTGASGDVSLLNHGTINVLTDGDTIRGPGNVTVKALGSTADVNTGGQVGGSTSIRGLGAGTVDVEAGHDINLGHYSRLRTAHGSSASVLG